MNTISNREMFRREVKIVGMKSGTDTVGTYSEVYNRVKDDYDIDLYKMVTDRRKQMQAERIANNKTRYTRRTLNQKISCIDIIEELGIWDIVNASLDNVKLELGVN